MLFRGVRTGVDGTTGASPPYILCANIMSCLSPPKSLLANKHALLSQGSRIFPVTLFKKNYGHRLEQ